MLAFAGLAHAHPTALSKTQLTLLTRSAQAAIKHQQDDLPNDSPSSIAWGSALKLGLPTPGGPVAAIALMRFAGLANRYCRVVVSTGDLAKATLIPVPASANYDHCTGAGPLLAVDLDGDGLADLVHTVELRSNRYPTPVSETLVYLGRRDAPSGFCYSGAASRRLAAADTGTAASLVRAAAAVRNRSSGAFLGCDKP